MTRANPNLNNHNGNNTSSSGQDPMQALLEALIGREDSHTCCNEQRDQEQAQLQAQLVKQLQRPPQTALPPQRQVDPNDFYDKFRKRCPPKFTETLDFTHANE